MYKMEIACIGWGSLIWNPGSLLIHRQWFMDGPFLPIEFARKSSDGRLTLVITPDAKPLRTLWALMATKDLDEAKNSLRIREGIPERNLDKHIGFVTKKETIKEVESRVQKLAEKRKWVKAENWITVRKWIKLFDFDAAIWTNLPPKFFNENENLEDGIIPTIDQVTEYLRERDINTFKTAEEYVRKTPKQIDTVFRRKFEAEFGWTSIE